MRIQRLVVQLALATFLLSSAGVPALAASPKDVAKAKKLSERAALATKEGRTDEAIELYGTAFELAGDTSILLTLGRMLRIKADGLFTPGADAEVAARAREIYLRAKAYLTKFVELAPDDIVRAEVDILLDDIEAKLLRVAEVISPISTGPALSRFGRVSVTSSMPGATVLLDGIRRGKTPVVLEGVEAGRHNVAVAKLGYNPFSTPVLVVAESTVEVHAELTTLTPLTPGSGVDDPVGGAGATAGGLEGEGAIRNLGIVGRWWFWTAVGGAVLVATVITSVLAATNSGSPRLPPGVELTFGDVRRIF